MEISIRKKRKPIPSEHIKAMTKDLRCYYNTKDTSEAELYSPNIELQVEIMHFDRKTLLH
jgi:hypothetical protein